MKVAELATRVLRSSGTGIIFCGFDQYTNWVSALKHHLLLVEPSPMTFLPPKAYATNRKSTYLVNQTQIAVIFHKNPQYYFPEVVIAFLN